MTIATINQQDDQALDFTFRDTDQPKVNGEYPRLNITGYTVKFYMRRRSTDETYLIEKTGTITNAAQGEATVNLTHDETDEPLGSYPSRIVLINGSGQRNTILKGDVVFA